MLLYILLLLPSADPALAQSKAEKIAALDAEQTFREAEEAAAGLIAKDLDSPTEFNYSRHPVEGRLGEYCDSMRRYSSIRKECERIRKSIVASFDKREEALAKNGKEDKFLEAMEKLESFESRYRDLRGVQDDGKNMKADTLLQKRIALVEEMRAFCPNLPDPEREKRCLEAARRIEFSLASHEESIRSGGYGDPPPAKRIYRATKPMLRCFVRLPDLGASSAPYEISDSLGRYRYEHLIKSRFGYAVNVKLSHLTKRSPNKAVTIFKTFAGPENKKRYSFRISTQYACSAGGSSTCRPSALAFMLTYEDGSPGLRQASASFPIKLDSAFDFSLPMDEDGLEEFNLNCVIASKIRKGGWIYSDEFFEEE